MLKSQTQKDLSNESRGFKYQIILKVLLSKYKENAEREFVPVYFTSATKTVIRFTEFFSGNF